MKISISSDPLLKVAEPDYFFSLASETGFDGVDLSLGFYDWKQIKNRDFSSILFDYDKSIEYAEKIAEYCHEYNMEILQTHAPAPTWYEGYPDEVNAMLTKSLINCIHITKAVGSRYMIVHPYFFAFSSDRQLTNPEIQFQLRAFVASGSSSGGVFGIPEDFGIRFLCNLRGQTPAFGKCLGAS